MLSLLFKGFILWIIWHMLRAMMRPSPPIPSQPYQPDHASPDILMQPCHICHTYLPVTKSLRDQQGRYYCCELHRQAGDSKP